MKEGDMRFVANIRVRKDIYRGFRKRTQASASHFIYLFIFFSLPIVRIVQWQVAARATGLALRWKCPDLSGGDVRRRRSVLIIGNNFQALFIKLSAHALLTPGDTADFKSSSRSKIIFLSFRYFTNSLHLMCRSCTTSSEAICICPRIIHRK